MPHSVHTFFLFCSILFYSTLKSNLEDSEYLSRLTLRRVDCKITIDVSKDPIVFLFRIKQSPRRVINYAVKGFEPVL